MTAVRITKFERHGDFFTANVTPDGADTVRVDNSCGSWTFTVDQSADPALRVARREVNQAITPKLQDRLRKAIAGELADEEESIDVAGNGNGRPAQTRAQLIAARMAAAGHRAVTKEGEPHV